MQIFFTIIATIAIGSMIAAFMAKYIRIVQGLEKDLQQVSYNNDCLDVVCGRRWEEQKTYNDIATLAWLNSGETTYLSANHEPLKDGNIYVFSPKSIKYFDTKSWKNGDRVLVLNSTIEEQSNLTLHGLLNQRTRETIYLYSSEVRGIFMTKDDFNESIAEAEEDIDAVHELLNTIKERDLEIENLKSQMHKMEHRIREQNKTILMPYQFRPTPPTCGGKELWELTVFNLISFGY